jgi:hypothetical protein
MFFVTAALSFSVLEQFANLYPKVELYGFKNS